MSKQKIIKLIYLLLFAMFLTNPNHDEFIYIIARQVFQYVKDDPEIEYEYEISSKSRQLAFEDKYATKIAYEFRKSESRRIFLIYNCLFFSFAKFNNEKNKADEINHGYFLRILKMNFTNFEEEFENYKKEFENYEKDKKKEEIDGQ